MNQPASFVHWSIFDVTVANLVLIAVMVVIFGAALLFPFPRGDRSWYRRPVPGPVLRTGPGSGSGSGSGSLDELAVGQPANGAKKA